MFTDENCEKSSTHMWLMVVGCVAMVFGMRHLLGDAVDGGSWGWIFVLACPLMHLWMMVSMRGESGKTGDSSENESEAEHFHH